MNTREKMSIQKCTLTWKNKSVGDNDLTKAFGIMKEVLTLTTIEDEFLGQILILTFCALN